MTRNYEIPLRAMLEFARQRQLSQQFCEKNFFQFDVYSFPLIFFFFYAQTQIDRRLSMKKNKIN